MATKKTTKTTSRATGIRKAAAKISTHCSELPVWILVALTFVLLIMSLAMTIKLGKVCDVDNNLARHKVDVFEDVASELIAELDAGDNNTQRTMTGYGISDEDDVLYVTFSYREYGDATMVEDVDLYPEKYGVLYFWKDKETGNYSHAYSYHNEPYHPGGEYYEKTIDLESGPIGIIKYVRKD